MSDSNLRGYRVLVLEDEFLIAMDVEEMCRDAGASDVVLCKTITEAGNARDGYDLAIVDLMLGGESTLPFADDLRRRNIPFIFASGFSERADVKEQFPEIAIVGKPYAADDLIAALMAAKLQGSRGED